ncbi:MAG: 5'-deoxyadenosine deaminase [Phycisphaerae bacterium]|nr:5'-deoxyadenosine deaminase [Phycisphaerae bacterium]
MILSAPWIVPITTPAIADGFIQIKGSGINYLGPQPLPATVETVQVLDRAIILPGLINAHTHLELSHLQGEWQQPRDLPEWLLRVVALQQQLSQTELEQLTVEAVQRGVEQSLQAGVTTVGDISRLCHLTRPLLTNGPLRVVSFGEVIGIGRRRHLIDDRLRIAADTRYNSPHLITGLSPHAPYSVEENGFKKVIYHAREHDLPVCTHLAETIEEIQFLQTGLGRFREMLETLGIWDERIPIPGITPIRWLCQMGLLGPDCLVAHGNYVDHEEIDLLCATGTSVAYCPRTHQHFQHEPYPLAELLGGGVNICLGTDSLASSPSLSILEEMINLHEQHPELPPELILQLGTINGARALGLAQQIGSLEPGKTADLAIFQLPDDEEFDTPADALLSGQCRLHQLYVAGEKIR